MDLYKIIKDNPDLNFTIKGKDLYQFGEEISDRSVAKYLEKKDEKVFSRKQVTEKFGICEATLWRWTKNGLIKSKKIGNRVFYAESAINLLIQNL